MQAYVFIGKSGSGKGTQVALLKEKLGTVFHLETGEVFRSFITSSSYTAGLTKAMMDEGKLPPSFIGIHVWSHELINQYKGEEIVLLDGTPRISEEVPVLLSAAAFYGWNVTVIYLDVSDDWARERLEGRGRSDDRDPHDRDERIAWFHKNVIPAIELLKEKVTVYTINGERSIEEIHENICNTLGI